MSSSVSNSSSSNESSPPNQSHLDRSRWRLDRRQWIAAGAAAAIAASAPASAVASPDRKVGSGQVGSGKDAKSKSKKPSSDAAVSDHENIDASQGRLRQGVARWCYPDLTLDQLAKHAASLGLVGIDLLEPNEFKTVKKHGLMVTMVSSHKLANGLCDPKFHDECLDRIHTAIEATAAEGWKNVICFSGNARGIDRKVGMKHCVDALKRITPAAEKAGVVLNMELLNSKVDHPDYMCDNSRWGIELVKRVESDHFKLLFDIYHMQIMEGDVIRTIQDSHPYLGHYHTAGNPGRHELDETQELNYKAIARAIADTGFNGFVSHEFRPTRDPVAGLKQAIQCCTC